MNPLRRIMLIRSESPVQVAVLAEPLDPPPPNIEFSGGIWSRVDDPDTGEWLGAYVYAREVGGL